ncbi:unnamed protein product [Arctogadus glacialis]
MLLNKRQWVRLAGHMRDVVKSGLAGQRSAHDAGYRAPAQCETTKTRWEVPSSRPLAAKASCEAYTM